MTIGLILCFSLTSKAQTKKKKTTPSKTTKSTTTEIVWETYTISTQNNLGVKRSGVASIKFPITPNQTSNNSNTFSYDANYKESNLSIDAVYFSTSQSVVDEGRMVGDLLPENYGQVVFNTLKSENPKEQYNLISYKNLPLGIDETKFTQVNSEGKVVYVRMRAVMRNRTLFQMLCKRTESSDDILCDKFFNTFSFTYK